LVFEWDLKSAEGHKTSEKTDQIVLRKNTLEFGSDSWWLLVPPHSSNLNLHYETNQKENQILSQASSCPYVHTNILPRPSVMDSYFESHYYNTARERDGFNLCFSKWKKFKNWWWWVQQMLPMLSICPSSYSHCAINGLFLPVPMNRWWRTLSGWWTMLGPCVRQANSSSVNSFSSIPQTMMGGTQWVNTSPSFTLR
jgi:hypothetical protein